MKWVLLVDPRGSRWDGTVARLHGGPSVERSVSHGEIAVFEPTGREVEVTITEQLRHGPKDKAVKAAEYRRVRTRLLSQELLAKISRRITTKEEPWKRVSPSS